jgi:hypothetical protein
MGDPVQLFAVSAVTMGLSHTIAKERLFAPLRDRLGGKETWLGYLVSCPYCASHWLAFVLVPLTGVYFIDVAPDWGLASRIIRWFLSCILVTVVAAFLRVAFYFVDETQGLETSSALVEGFQDLGANLVDRPRADQGTSIDEEGR